MQKYAFRMQLNPGMADEYRRRHDEIWPELLGLLKGAGISDSSIHLDPATHALFAVLLLADDHRMDDLAFEPVMQRWWAHMSDIMATRPDHAPLAVPLIPMFYLP